MILKALIPLKPEEEIGGGGEDSGCKIKYVVK